VLLNTFDSRSAVSRSARSEALRALTSRMTTSGYASPSMV
jgi:hypothetical protein